MNNSHLIPYTAPDSSSLSFSQKDLAPDSAGFTFVPKNTPPDDSFQLKIPPQSGRRFQIDKSAAVSMALLFIIILGLGCTCCRLFLSKDPAYMDLAHYNTAPCSEFPFGTDAVGRDIFSMIWYGGRISLFIGFAAAFISTVTAILFGTVSGLAPQWLDACLMRAAEILISIPNLLLVIFIQAIWGKADLWSLSLIIGLTSWFGIAKVVRIQVRQLRSSEYVIAARCMGGGFFHILRKHLAPNFVSSILFMAVMNIRNAIAAESTLSFMGLGLPLEVISWGSMLSNADRSLLSGAWWIILMPGLFLIATLSSITKIGNWLRIKNRRRDRIL